jgi:hypothetical protein
MNGKRGELIECTDSAIREYIIWDNESQPENKQFVIKTMLPVHLFVKRESAADSIPINHEFDSNKIDESDSQL